MTAEYVTDIDFFKNVNTFLTLSSLSQSPCLSDTLQNGQKAAPVSPKSSSDVQKQQPMMDNSKQIRPAGTRRCVNVWKRWAWQHQSRHVVKSFKSWFFKFPISVIYV